MVFVRGGAPISRSWAAVYRRGLRQARYKATRRCMNLNMSVWLEFPPESCTNVLKIPVVGDCRNSYEYSSGFIPYIRHHVNLFPVNVPITSSTVHRFLYVLLSFGNSQWKCVKEKSKLDLKVSCWYSRVYFSPRVLAVLPFMINHAIRKCSLNTIFSPLF